MWFCRCALFLSLASAQQTLGGIPRPVNDLSGGAIVHAQVTRVAYLTKRTHAETSSWGSYDFLSLPNERPVGLVFATAFCSRLQQQGATLFLAYVLVPDGRIRANILSQERGALTGFEVDQANAKRA